MLRQWISVITLLIFWQPAVSAHLKPSLFSRPNYLPKDTISYFHVESSDQKNGLYLNGLMDWHADSFFDTQGIILNLGTKGEPLLTQNSVLRTWFYSLTPVIEAKLDQNIHFFATPDFGQQQIRIFDIFADINYWRSLSVVGGLQKSLIAGFEVLNTPVRFNYFSFPSNMAPNREVAVTFYGAMGPQRPHSYNFDSHWGLNDFFSYQLALTNGNADGSFPGVIPFKIEGNRNRYQFFTFSTGNKAFEGRIFLNPFVNQSGHFFQNLGFGFAGSAMTVVNQIALPAYLSIAKDAIFQFGGQETIVAAQGVRNRFHPQWIWYKDQWAISGDYVLSFQHLSLNFRSHTEADFNDLVPQKNSAAQIQILYNLTGEEYKLGWLEPERPFRPFDSKDFGQIQLGLRWSMMNLDPNVFQASYVTSAGRTQYYYADPRVSVQKANAWSFLVNWAWNKFFIWSTEFSYTQFIGGCSTGALQDPERPGCLTARNSYIAQPGSQVINRPNEMVLFQRMSLLF